MTVLRLTALRQRLGLVSQQQAQKEASSPRIQKDHEHQGWKNERMRKHASESTPTL
jgi:hypothetical protein